MPKKKQNKTKDYNWSDSKKSSISIMYWKKKPKP